MINIIVQAVDGFFTVLSILIFIRVILSWVGIDYEKDKKFKFLFDTTEPILEPFRKLLSKWQSGIMMDFSPIIALFFLDIIRRILMTLLSTI
ncbi:MAG TPA: YggT family protein [Clostridiales bacterium]|nr:MAG: hypothetical protein A2Y22_08525 [Clostridiales bacterium GWD2_32_59]HAN09393.1 YggT family protein [Clostridiales bacterium]